MQIALDYIDTILGIKKGKAEGDNHGCKGWQN